MRGSITATDLDDAIAAIKRLSGDLPNRALADALNHTANQARQALVTNMEDVFDRPSRWVLNSPKIIHAKPTGNLNTIETVVTVKDGALGNSGHDFDEWFSAQVYGSNRLTKGSEKALRQMGILPAGRFIVPTDSTPRDGQGGIKRGWMIQLLSGLGALNKSGSDHNATDSKRSITKGHAAAFFVLRRGKVPIGIGERRGKDDMKVVLLFSRSAPSYRARFRFHDVVRRVAEDDGNLEANIDKAIVDALNGKLPGQSAGR